MANWCDFTGKIKTANIERLRQLLELKISEADTQKMALFIGSERYLFDAFINVNDDELELIGNVKWCFSTDEMENFVKFLLELDVNIQSIEVEYEEPGCELFGRYFYEGGIIVHEFINDTDYPEYNEDYEAYYEKLVETLNESGVEESWEIAG